MTASVASSMMGGNPPNPPSTLVAQIGLNDGGVTYYVNSADGNLYSFLNASGHFGGILTFLFTGGTLPYVNENHSIVTEFASAGSVYIDTVPVTGDTHQTIYWTGLGLGDLIICHLHVSIQDSGTPQQTATNDYPDSGSLVIKRTS